MVTKKQILAQLKELTDLIKSEKFKSLEKDSEDLHKIQSLLSSVRFRVKDINYLKEEEIVQIRYELPVINLKIDEEGRPNKNDFFYSVNMLELISLEDMQKIQEVLEKCKLVERK